MTVELRGGLGRSELVGAGTYFRLVFARGLFSGVDLTDDVWFRAVRGVYDEFWRVGIAYTVSPFAVARSDKTAVIDVRVPPDRKTATVADLISAVEDVCDVFGVDPVQLVAIARISEQEAKSKTAAQDRDAAAAAADKVREKQKDDSWAAQLLARLRSIGTVTYWLVILLLVAGVGYLAWRAYSVARKVAA